MNKKIQFRQEVFEQLKDRHVGSVIHTPRHFKSLTIGFSLLTVLIVIFLIFGSYTEKYVVRGYLESTKGIARVYPQKNGVIVRQFKQQGDVVKKGEPLFLIDTSSKRLHHKKEPHVLSMLKKKQRLIDKEIAYKKSHLAALKPLLDKRYIALSTYHEQREALATLKQQKQTIQVDILNYQHEQSYVIDAPIDGLISSVIYQEGQYTHVSKPLMKILPSNGQLMAILFIPMKQSGFLQQNAPIILRYDAYPYARFGTSLAHVQDISRSVLTDEEEDKPLHVGEPYYKITALLAKPVMNIYGETRHLQQGMTLTAVIIGSRRRIWQWIFDPLYSFYGEMIA